WLAEGVSDSSGGGVNRGAVTGRSKKVRPEGPSGEVAVSGVPDSTAVAVAGCTLTLVWHLGQRTVNGRDGVLASSSCKRASHFEQMRTMVVFQVAWLVCELVVEAEREGLW